MVEYLYSSERNATCKSRRTKHINTNTLLTNQFIDQTVQTGSEKKETNFPATIPISATDTTNTRYSKNLGRVNNAYPSQM